MKQIKQNRIFAVSCQALEGEPLFGNGIMTKMAKAAIKGGANWIRTSQLDNIRDIKKNVNAPVIGIIKQRYPNSKVFITPTKKELQSLITSNVDIVALDATLRQRPQESLVELVTYFRKHKKNHQLLMADCSDLIDAQNADKLGFDLIGTTLAGYTKATKDNYTPAKDFLLIKQIKAFSNKIIVAEGGIETPAQAKRAFECGANIVVVGNAITRPHTIVARFVKIINERKQNENY